MHMKRLAHHFRRSGRLGVLVSLVSGSPWLHYVTSRRVTSWPPD